MVCGSFTVRHAEGFDRGLASSAIVALARDMNLLSTALCAVAAHACPAVTGPEQPPRMWNAASLLPCTSDVVTVVHAYRMRFACFMQLPLRMDTLFYARSGDAVCIVHHVRQFTKVSHNFQPTCLITSWYSLLSLILCCTHESTFWARAQTRMSSGRA